MSKFYLATFLLIFITGHVSAFELSDIIDNIAIKKQRTTYFTETKTSFFLSEGIISKGTLKFNSPDILYKKITSPIVSGTKIRGDELSIINLTEPVRITLLSNYPTLELSINAIRWMLSGNTQALNIHFQITSAGTKQQWFITLHPKDEDLKEDIEYISLSGNAKMIQQFVVKRSNGETITTDLHDTP